MRQRIKWLSKSRLRFDQETGSFKPENPRKNRDENYQRTEFYEDLGSIIHLSQFRRMSQKTQVYSNPEDNVRTRLTHSIEVSNIAKQLLMIFLEHLRKQIVTKSDIPINLARDLETILESSCLAHDIGHPPFAHAGEKLLQSFSCNLSTRFDSNIQNLRLLTGLSPIGRIYKLHLTCAVLDSVMKEKPRGISSTENYGGSHTAEYQLAETISKETGTYVKDRAVIDEFKSLAEEHNIHGLCLIRHPLTYFMTSADDLSNLTSDLEDAIKKRILSTYDVVDFAISKKLIGADSRYKPVSSRKAWMEKLHECEKNGHYGPIKSTILRGLLARTADVLREIAQNIPESESWEEILSNLHVVLARESLKRRGNDLETGNFLFMKTNDNSSSNWSTEIDSAAYKKWLYNENILKSKRVLNDNAKARAILSQVYSLLVPSKNDVDFFDSAIKRAAFICRDCKDQIVNICNSTAPEAEKRERVRVLFVDFIAGMTDRHAMKFVDDLRSSPAMAEWAKTG